MKICTQVAAGTVLMGVFALTHAQTPAVTEGFPTTAENSGGMIVAQAVGAQPVAPTRVREVDPADPRKVWILSPRSTKEVREQALRNRTSVQFVEPAYSALGEPTFRRISVNCFEPSVGVQYIENRRAYNGLYIRDTAGWSDERTSGRRLPFDVEPSAQDLERYLQQGCAGQMYPQGW